jgi:hypothetical protein
METLKRNRETLVFLSFIVVSAVAGWGVPWSFEWSNTQQGQVYPRIIRLGIVLMAVGIALCFLLPRLLLPRQTSELDKQPPIWFRFTMRRVMVAMALTVIWVGSSPQLDVAVCRFNFIGMFCYAGWLLRHNQADRWAVVALFSCMFLPYLWLAFDRSLMRMLETPAVIIGFPAFVPQLLIGVVIGQRTVEWFWMGALLTAIQMRVGFWMIQLGPKPTIAFLVYSLVASLLGSCFLFGGLTA